MIVISIMVASVFAKNRICYPLGYDFSCSYGVPLAIWEHFSEDGRVAARLISNEYAASAISFETGNAYLNLLIDASINILLCCLMLNMQGEDKRARRMNVLVYCSAIYLSCVLWATVFIDWRQGLYRVFYLNILAAYIILLLLAIVRVILVVGKRLEPETKPEK